MPEEIQGQVQGTQAAAAPEVAAPAPAPAGTPAPYGAAPQPAAGTQAQGAGMDVMSLLRQHGVEGNFTDPAQAISQLAASHRQAAEYRQLAQYGQEYLRNQAPFQEWQRQRQEEEQRKASQSQQWWKAPEYDASWPSKVYRDQQTGELRALPGADPTIPQKLAAWHDHQRSFMDRFSQDPLKAIQPGIEQLIDQRAAQLIERQLGGYREQVSAREILGQNASWIYEQDPAGGARTLSQQGRAYQAYVQQASQLGIASSQGQHDYALGFVQRDYLLAQARGQQAQTPEQQQAAANERYLQQAAGAQHRPGSAPAAPATPNGAPSQAQAQAGGQRGLEEMLMRNMGANGYTAGQVINRR